MPYVGSRRDLLMEYEIALVCERLHKLPSEVLAEDAYLLRRMMALLGENDRIKNMRSEQARKKQSAKSKR